MGCLDDKVEIIAHQGLLLRLETAPTGGGNEGMRSADGVRIDNRLGPHAFTPLISLGHITLSAKHTTEKTHCEAHQKGGHACDDRPGDQRDKQEQLMWAPVAAQYGVDECCNC
jgi:hypothetical protein